VSFVGAWIVSAAERFTSANVAKIAGSALGEHHAGLLHLTHKWLLACAAGDLKLDGLRMNQLKLCKQLTGSLSLSDRGLHLKARALILTSNPDPSPTLTLNPALTLMLTLTLTSNLRPRH